MKKISNTIKMTELKLIPTNTFEYEEYKTEFFTEKNLKEFLLKESIPCLSSRFKEAKEFYEKIIFKLPQGRETKNYKFIYSHLVKYYPHDYCTKKELAELHKIPVKKILAEGSVSLLDTSLKEKPLVRWLLVKN